MYIFIDSLITLGASTRGYRFTVYTDRDILVQNNLYEKLSNPSVLSAKVEEQNQENTIFVGNIPFEAKDKDIKEFFESCGDIVSVIMPKGKSAENFTLSINLCPTIACTGFLILFPFLLIVCLLLCLILIYFNFSFFL